MLVAIRDDDTCYFTKRQQLESVYGPYWDVCPVTLSTIPFIDGRVTTKPPVVLVPEEFRSNTKKYPVGDNKELVAYLKEQIPKKRVGISMHGYCHIRENGIPEFESRQEFSEKVVNAKKYLEELFGIEITVFTPPNNSMSRKNVKAVIDAGMNIAMAYGFYPWERPMNYKTVKSFVSLFMHYLKHRRDYPYPGVLDCGTHKEHPCVVMGTFATFEQLKGNFDFLRSKKANMCIATHYADLYYMPEYKKVFCQFMDYLLSNHRQDIEFVTVDRLFETENSR